MDGTLGFSVKPTKVRVGGSVSIKGSRGDRLHVLLPTGTARTVRLDKAGTCTLKEPLGREGTFTITDFHKTDPHSVDVSVFELE